MALGQKKNQIFEAHDTLELSEKTQASLDAVKANPTDAVKSMELGICLKHQM